MKKKNLLALFLALMMASSTATAFAACGGDDDASSSSSSSSSNEDLETEDLAILNSDFETYDDKDGTYPMVTDVQGWTWSRNTASSGTAIESKSASGIVDTDPEAWKQFTTSGLPSGKSISYLVEHVDEAEDLWEDMTAKDKVEFYDAWEKANPKKEIEEELDFYEELNIDVDDLMVFKNNKGEEWATIENPGTHDGLAEETQYEKTNTKVLMLRNDHSSNSGDFIGTAAKYTSSTNVTVEAGTTAVFSVWVNTANLRDQRNETLVDKGAYIQITHALGSKTQSPLLVKNINTNGEWVQYSFTLKGSTYTSSSFTIVLGLGLTGGTNRLEYVNGVAFFDDIECKTMQTSEYVAPATTELVDIWADSKEYPQNEAEAFHYTLDFTQTWDADDTNHWNWDVLSNLESTAPTTEQGTSQTYSSVPKYETNNEPIIPYPTLNGGFSQVGDIVGKFNSVTEALNDASNPFAQAVYNSTFKPTEKDDEDNDIVKYLTDKPALVLFSANGAAYTAKTNDFEIKANDKVMLSFFVKTSEMNGLTGATVKLVDNEGNPALSIDSTTATKIEVDETDIHDGWVQCFFFIHNDSGMDITNLHFEFSYGPTTIIGTPKSSYQAGYAVFTNFETKTMSDKAFECAVASDHAKVVTLSGKVNDFAGDSGFGTPTLSEATNIEYRYALAKEYTGIYSDSVLVGGNSTATNAYANAGLLDKEHAANYADILENLGADATLLATAKNLENNADAKQTAKDAAWAAVWNSVFGDNLYNATATRPLVIETEENKAYGFVGNVASVAANSTKTVSLRVKVSAGAIANVYLVDTTDKDFNVLSVERSISYWYDEEGNVLSKDPSDDDFYARYHTAFKKQSNGLYKVNPTWEYAESIVDKDAYYANLQAYEYDAKSGNLLLDSQTTYAYNDDWKHDGNDGYAFYDYNDTEKSAYAYSNKTVKVLDFSNVTDLQPRYDVAESDGLSVTVEPTGENWVEVVFYLRAGATAKSYRLEVWNGSRDGQTTSAKDSFVAFDSWSVPSDDSSIDTWLSEAKEEEDKKDEADRNYFENVFSFYDNGQYLRYDSSLDQNKVGDAFTSYVYAAEGQGVAYLTKKTENRITTYANFTFEENVQTPDPVTDNSDDSNNSDNSDTGEETNPWLLGSSIAVAAALLLAVVSLIIRKVVAYVRKKRGIVVVQKPKREKKEKQSK